MVASKPRDATGHFIKRASPDVAQGAASPEAPAKVQRLRLLQIADELGDEEPTEDDVRAQNSGHLIQVTSLGGITGFSGGFPPIPESWPEHLVWRGG